MIQGSGLSVQYPKTRFINSVLVARRLYNRPSAHQHSSPCVKDPICGELTNQFGREHLINSGSSSCLFSYRGVVEIRGDHLTIDIMCIP